MKTFYKISKTILFIVFALSMSSSVIFSQINAGGEPMSSMIALESSFSTEVMPSVDIQKLIEEDKALANIPDMPLRYGVNFDVNYNLDNSGTWQTLTDGSRVWRLGIRSQDAVSLNLAYTDFQMPKGATFFVYNVGKINLYGAFTDLNNTSDGVFATSPTYGSTTVLEYYEPVYSRGQGRLSVSKVTHAYKDIFGYNSVLEEPCNINVICPIGAPWGEQKRSVTRITFAQGTGSFLCSGSLINNTLNNRTPYYLFAEHCATDNYNTIVFYFNYESPTCIGTAGSLSNTMTGATLKAANFDTDFRLVQLNQPVPAAFNAFYNGWDRSGSNPVIETSIHHPGGVNKKISIDNQPAQSVTGFGGRLVNGFWLVTWDEGMTEGGSSGSPMFDQNKRVIGQNLGGTPANCINPQGVQKYFGKLSESWAHGGSSSNQLKEWLDPNNSGVATLDGIDDVTGVAPVTNFTSNIQTLPIGGGQVDFFDMSTNGPLSWSWSFPGGTPSTSNVRNPSGISYSVTGVYTVSLTATNSFGSNIKTFPAYIKVQGVPMAAFNNLSPLPNTTVIVNQNDPSIFQFRWQSTSPNTTVSYKFKIKKAGRGAEYLYTSDNNGLDSVISFRKSFLDSLAITLGTTGDSAICVWRATANNGADSLSTNQTVITIRRNPVGINQISSIIPGDFNLYNNYPNPFNPKTIIKFDVSKSQHVVLKVFNMLGEVITTLVNENLSPGSYNVDFNAVSMSSGMYFYRLETEGFAATRRMVLIK